MGQQMAASWLCGSTILGVFEKRRKNWGKE